ncbi:hypothetical protein GCM10027217_13890 [Pseudomaricurvus hydrocarbonicus]
MATIAIKWGKSVFFPPVHCCPHPRVTMCYLRATMCYLEVTPMKERTWDKVGQPPREQTL